jgi:phospholipid/cholesterol/gamma-HCH transport system substrate-binding protein
MSRSLSRMQALLLGLVVLVSLALLATGLFAVASRGWYGSHALRIGASFADIRGVEVGTRVRIQGIDAGEVTALEPPQQPGDAVLVRLLVKSEYRHLVRTHSRVQIASEGMLGGKVLEIQLAKQGLSAEAGPPVEDGAVLASIPSTELADLIGQADKAMQTLQTGPGSIARLANESTAHDSLVATLQQFKETAASIQQVSDAMHRLPLVGGYVESPVSLLERPECSRDRRVFSEADLFEPASAILTTRGKERLDNLAPWLDGMKHPGSEVVVVAYADPQHQANAPSALVVTRKQSQAVCDYLKSKHAIQKMGWFSSRKVTGLGLGVNPPPSLERDALPPARLEVQVFVPVRQ